MHVRLCETKCDALPLIFVASLGLALDVTQGVNTLGDTEPSLCQGVNTVSVSSSRNAVYYSTLYVSVSF